MFHRPAPHRTRRGTSLVEVIVSLMLLAIVVTGVASAASAIRRSRAAVDAGWRVDLDRENILALARKSPACLDGGAPRVERIAFPAAGRRAAVSVGVRCGS